MSGVSGRAATLVNYDPKQPTLASLVPWRNPALVKIFFSFEFWFYVNFHVLIVFCILSGLMPELPVDWNASGAFQYFTTFFLTFYNGNCYDRYQKLYTGCCDLMDATLLFVREMTICFKDKSTWKHRRQATKWLLAAVDLFFMGVCGNKLSMKEWSEVVKKGLLTKPEAQLLLKYPGPEVVPILTTWTMICITDALELPVFHERKDPEWPMPRVQKIAHIHNRLDFLMQKMMVSYRLISETMAQPIPFAYWHLMNLVFSLNFLLLALILAAYKHWLTIIPYSMALITFMGLREVSNQLADPFGDDIVDFPLAKYLDYTFDHTVCLLQAFSMEDAYERVRRQINVVTPFTERQVRRHVGGDNLYTEAYAAHSDSVYIWEKEQPLAECAAIYEKESLQDYLKKSLSAIPIGKGSAGDEHVDEEDFGQASLTDRILDAEDELERLRAVDPDVTAEVDKLERFSSRAINEMATDQVSLALAMQHAMAREGGLETTTLAKLSAEARAQEETMAQSASEGRLMPPPAGAGVTELLQEDRAAFGQPLARSDEIRSNRPSKPGAGRAGQFDWNVTSTDSRLKNKKGEGSERSFRMEEVRGIYTDDSGKLRRQGGGSSNGGAGGRDARAAAARGSDRDLFGPSSTARTSMSTVNSMSSAGSDATEMKTHRLDQTPLDAPPSSFNQSRLYRLNKATTFEEERVSQTQDAADAARAPAVAVGRLRS